MDPACHDRNQTFGAEVASFGGNTHMRPTILQGKETAECLFRAEVIYNHNKECIKTSLAHSLHLPPARLGRAVGRKVIAAEGKT